MKIIQQYFKDTISTITKTNLGLSNDNYKVVVKGKTYMVRLPSKISSSLRNHSVELEALQCVKDLSFTIANTHYDASTGILIAPFIENLKVYHDEDSIDKVQQVAKTLKKLHALNTTISENFSPHTILASFEQNLTNRFLDLKPFSHVLNDIPTNFKPTLCHNDLVDGNLVFKDHKLYIIDYEYAANNDPLFDIMSFFTENNIHDADIRNSFYKTYFENEPVPITQLDAWENYQNYLWCTWAMMMYEHNPQEVYKEIALNKFQQLQNKKVG